jgi:amino acid transporter
MKLNFNFFLRKKKFSNEDTAQTNLSRVLGLLDISAIGISSTLGSGIYILAGSVIKNYTGPSLFLSFVCAGFATFFSGICYAELGARVPRSGSAYVYIYVTIGEFVAFMMGWDLILEYIIGTASTSNALSQYIDYAFDRKIRTFLLAYMPMDLTGLGPYPDFLAFGLACIVTCMMIVGVKESAFANKLFTLVNVLILAFIIVIGATKANFSNWNLAVNSNTSWIDTKGKNQSCGLNGCGKGGFMPYDLDGIINGAAKCFFAFIGFDAIASTGEEVMNPKRNIPISILITLTTVSILYCSSAAVLTLMVPYYMTDADTPLAQAFEHVHLNWAKNVVSFGATLALFCCLYAGMFPMPRIVYSMADDGLIFKFLSKLLPKLKTPYVASIVTGFFAAILASIFDLEELVEMLSIGTLMAYTLVSVCVLTLRYRFEEDDLKNKSPGGEVIEDDSLLKKWFAPSSKLPTRATAKFVNWLTLLCILDIIAISFIVSKIGLKQWYLILIVSVLAAGFFFFSVVIWLQPQVANITTFKVPLVPFIPFLSVFFNVYMMTTLGQATWTRFIAWFVVGIVIYFTYGIRNSKLMKTTNEVVQNKIFPFIEHENKNKTKKSFFKSDGSPKKEVMTIF